MRRSYRSVLLFLPLVGCGSSASLLGAADAGSPDVAQPVVDASADAKAVQTTDAATADVADAGLADAITPVDAPSDVQTSCTLPEASTDRVVSILVTNQASSDRYLVTGGWYCDSFEIRTSSGALARNVGFQCICECPNPGSAAPNALRKLAPGESFTLTWDASMLATCSKAVDCSAEGWPNLPPATEVIGGSQPAPAGDYTAVAAALTALPSGCNSSDGTTYSCTSNPGPGGPGGPSAPPNPQVLCPSSVTGSAPFTLPAAGNLSVAVAITK